MADSREKAIFLSAIDLPSPVERDAFLERECGGDAALRRAVDELLQRHDRSVNVLDKVPTPCVQLGRRLDELALRWSDDPTPPLEPASTADRAGEWVGAYRLMEKIGEGGFGQVYVAEQLRPVRRRVALKLLKPWMDSREIIARFEAERQALALMEHPNIASVLDAGTTAAGQPYFVMELVRGVPITTFCEQRRLNIRQRMRLFIDVCLAVQHAHQKGVIHRDLKPTNVLVALYEGAADGESDRFRRLQGARGTAHGQDDLHAVRPDDRHPDVHEPRAGRDEFDGHRHAQRRLLAGRADVRTADDVHALRSASHADGHVR